MKKTVLIVDDEITTRNLLENTISSFEEFEVLSAVDGLDALELIIKHKPDLVITDILMPRLDGRLLCEILHRVDRWKNIPVILLSRMVGRENIKEGLNVGALTYIEKPINIETIRSKIDSVLLDNTTYPNDLNKEHLYLLHSLVTSIKSVFGLCLGEKSEIHSIKKTAEIPEELRADYVSKIVAKGAGRIELSIGWDQTLGATVCSALSQNPIDQIQKELILDVLSDINCMILEKTIKIMQDVLPFHLCPPNSSYNSTLPVNKNTKEFYVFDISLSKLPFLLAIEFKNIEEI